MAIESLSTSRVLVIDDKPEEAVPILTALGKAGVGCVYLRGDKVEELPTKPIEGIRLVFLDMRLAEGGDQRAVLSKTVGVLKKCISGGATPVVVVCWTKHPDDVAAFKAMVSQSLSPLMGDHIAAMAKPMSGNPKTWKSTFKRIKETLKPYDALNLVWQWENVLHRAATETSQTLADVSARMVASSNGAIADWQEGMFAVCRSLVKAEAGKTTDRKGTSNALFRVMNELAVDSIHHAILRDPLPCADKLIPQDYSGLGLEDTSRLNQMIFVDPVRKGDVSITPGSVYVKSRGTSKCLFKKLGIGPALIKKHIGLKKADKGGVPILIELSPACDFVLGQRPVCTFIAGLLLPGTISLSNAGYREVYGPLTIPGYEGPRKIAVTKRLVYACSLRRSGLPNHPICRLRSNVLIDLQVKTAMFKARPGAICLEAGGPPAKPPQTTDRGKS
ncbi:MAG: hypothetical protein ABFE13_04100 [Phycisphaerales bacterium]